MNRCTQLDEILHEHNLTTSETVLNFKVIGQRSRSHGFISVCVMVRLPADST